jgi:hypothetical protein
MVLTWKRVHDTQVHYIEFNRAGMVSSYTDLFTVLIVIRFIEVLVDLVISRFSAIQTSHTETVVMSNTHKYERSLMNAIYWQRVANMSNPSCHLHPVVFSKNRSGCTLHDQHICIRMNDNMIMKCISI